jgi:flagellar hook-associated protein 1 FlgK
MTLTAALNTSLTGLNVAQEGITVSSNNVANVATPGYIKQSVNQVAVVDGGNPQGAKIIGIAAPVDEQLLKSIYDQTSLLGQANTMSDYYDKAQRLLGQPGANNSLSDQIDKYFAAFQSLSNNPQTVSLRLSAVDNAKKIASNFNDTATGLQQLRLNADRQIQMDVNSINSLIDNLAISNVKISSFDEGTSGRLSIEQERSFTLRKLSEYIDITTAVGMNGKISVLTKGGAPLLEGNNKYHIKHITAASIDNFVTNLAMNSITVVGIRSDGTETEAIAELSSRATSANVTTNIESGTLKSLLDLRDRDIPKVLAQLDNLADTFRTQVNAIHNDGVSFPPPSSLIGTRSVASTDEVGFSGKVMFAVVNTDGTPAISLYPDESAFRPLTLDLSTLDSGDGAGYPTVQTIMDEINYYLGPPQNRAAIGNLRDISLAAVSDSISDAGTVQFDLQLDNVSTQNSTVVVNSITVIDPTDLSQAYNAATLPVPNTYTIDPGNRERTNIPFTVDFGGDDNRVSYTVRLNVTVTAEDGTVSTADIDYTVADNVTGTKNDRYPPQAVSNVTGTGNFYIAPSSQTYAHVDIVDEDGDPVSAGTSGFLKITTASGANFGIAIDEMNSQEIGLVSTPSANVTGRGFSHYFELNNLFVRNDTVAGSAINMAVRSDIAANTGLLASGELVLSNQPSDPNSALYTYELGSGNNANILRMAELGNTDVQFSSAGTLSATNTSLGSYSADITGYTATTALDKSNIKFGEKLGLEGLDKLLHDSAGVNTDDELALVIELQNNYTASAKIISILQEMFRILKETF